MCLKKKKLQNRNEPKERRKTLIVQSQRLHLLSQLNDLRATKNRYAKYIPYGVMEKERKKHELKKVIEVENG